ncbi:MAG TPA: hypothetical protein VHC98_03380, partial [Candidatus Saccharimonadales bacterium]|nr:hypothetical protein [Candidatus Saccharimonadales bacterium]
MFGPFGNEVFAGSCPKGMSQIDCDAILNNWVDWVPGVNTCVQANTTLQGYTLPASSGRTGDEQPINDQGYVTDDQGNVNGGRVTFWQFASKGQAYRDYYIAMRWNYVKWNWDGTSTDLDNTQLQWMQKQPRLLIVTDKNTGKSIIAVAMEAGPAPWTGVDAQPNNDPKEGWQNPQAGTPNDYKGRVSGLPPAAIAALGAKQGMQDGSGDILTYGWAPDQTATPGPTQTPSGATNTAACAGGVGPGNVVWYSQRDSRWANESVYCGTYGDCGCYLTALAMIVSTITSQKVLPDQIVSQTGGHSDVYGTAAHYHMSVQS